MRLICPHCMSGVTVSDDAAGKDATCPNCGKAFPTPARYSAEVMSPTPPLPPVAPPPTPVPEVPPTPAAGTAPPGYVPPAPQPVATGFLPPPAAAPAPAEVPAMAGYAKSCGITISPKVVAWLPALLLTCVFVLTFFPWVGCYAGNSPVYSQRPWGAMLNSAPNRDYKLEEAGTIPGGWLDKKPGDWKLMLPSSAP